MLGGSDRDRAEFPSIVEDGGEDPARFLDRETSAEALATDGGRDVHDLADATGYSLSTIYRCLQRLDGVIDSDNGYVEFVSDKLRQEVRSIVDSIERGVDVAARRAATLVDVDVRQTASSSFSRWLAKYGAEFVPPEENGREDDSPVVRIDTVLSELRSSPNPRLLEVLDEMLRAWTSDGRDASTLRNGFVEANVSGQEITASIGATL